MFARFYFVWLFCKLLQRSFNIFICSTYVCRILYIQSQVSQRFSCTATYNMKLSHVVVANRIQLHAQYRNRKTVCNRCQPRICIKSTDCTDICTILFLLTESLTGLIYKISTFLNKVCACFLFIFSCLELCSYFTNTYYNL